MIGIKPIQTPGENPRFFYSGARDKRGYGIYAIESKMLKPGFRISAPNRIHDIVHRPFSSQSLAFARRPGNFVIVFDRVKGVTDQMFNSTDETHFYGHGAFSTDGKILYASENRFVNGLGVIGIYDADNQYRKIGEFPSGGIGPHEIKMLRHTNTLVVANGGVRTHPDTGRSKLNLNSIHSNLSYLHGETGEIIEQRTLKTGYNQSSIRHIDIAPNDNIVFAIQYYGPRTERPALIGVHHQGSPLTPLELSPAILKQLKNFCGSISIINYGQTLAVSAPKGNKVLTVSLTDGSHNLIEVQDGCGVISGSKGELIVSSGQGDLKRITNSTGEIIQINSTKKIQWDNHLA